MSADTTTKRNLCRFDSESPCTNIDRLSSLTDNDDCDHIRRVTPTSASYDLYVVMDSNCHQASPPASGRCDKPESDFLWLLLKWTIKNWNTRPRAVTCVLKSLRQDLLRFPDGSVDGVISTLNLKEKPLWMKPIYKKAGKPHCRLAPVIVAKTPGVVLEHAPVEVDVLLWKEYPDGGNSKQKTHMEVTIPPGAGSAPAAPPVSILGTGQASAQASPMSPGELLEVLSKLTPAVFDRLVITLEIPHGQLSSQQAPQDQRANQLMLWVTSQGTEYLRRLEREVRKAASRPLRT